MPISLEVDQGTGVAILTVRGAVDDETLLSMYTTVAAAEDLDEDFALLIDLREAKGLAVTSEGVRELARHDLVLRAEARRAVVVPSELGFGMSRMYQLLREDSGSKIRVFRNFAEARVWVGGLVD